MKLLHAQAEHERARERLAMRTQVTKGSRVLSSMILDGANLQNVTISSTTNAFQKASMRDCDLRNATLQGGPAAFQSAQFDGARLINAKLSGGVSSFQGATFVNADLTRAVLTGGSSSFQGASFEGATLCDAQIVCSGASFQSVNISGASFQGADLSALESYSLEACYFAEPPLYDGRTKFPDGFDPVARLWSRALAK